MLFDGICTIGLLNESSITLTIMQQSLSMNEKEKLMVFFFKSKLAWPNKLLPTSHPTPSLVWFLSMVVKYSQI